MVRFGMGMAPVEPLPKVVATAKLAEELGFEYFGHADQRFQGEKDAFVVLAADALSTSAIRLGPCVSDPYSRSTSFPEGGRSCPSARAAPVSPRCTSNAHSPASPSVSA